MTGLPLLLRLRSSPLWVRTSPVSAAMRCGTTTSTPTPRSIAPATSARSSRTDGADFGYQHPRARAVLARRMAATDRKDAIRSRHLRHAHAVEPGSDHRAWRTAYTDWAIDTQIDRTMVPDGRAFVAGTYIRENSNLVASAALRRCFAWQPSFEHVPGERGISLRQSSIPARSDGSTLQGPSILFLFTQIRCERKRQWRSARLGLHCEFLVLAMAEPAALCAIHGIHEFNGGSTNYDGSRSQRERQQHGLPGREIHLLKSAQT